MAKKAQVSFGLKLLDFHLRICTLAILHVSQYLTNRNGLMQSLEFLSSYH